ncbi:hypothetical protein Enr8_37060 [Blastopirellula retiformator]|uniref:Uncharacterized protein n=1 Tax=Blastopirellula retiformator TaxID=2527970 RepID=A0A5C5V233_9BACT|nr:hypothetical protein Enr8_37060 [Blastopirellula retiformator]
MSLEIAALFGPVSEPWKTLPTAQSLSVLGVLPVLPPTVDFYR